MRLALTRLLALGALAAATAGAYVLDIRHDLTAGYALLLAGAVVASLLPEPPENAGGAAADWLIAALLLCAAITLNARVATSVGVRPDLPGATQTAFWLIGSLCLPLAFHFVDRRLRPLARFFERADWLWILGLSLAALAARIHGLGTGPPGLSGDEIRPLGQTFQVVRGADLNAFWTDFQGYNGIFHYFSSFSIGWLGSLGVNVVQAAKLPGALLAGLSVGLLYLAVRSVADRPVAATAGLLLVWQGWHWSLSRFYYQYAADLGWIAASFAFVLAGLRTGRFSLLAAGGFAAAAGASWLKTAVLSGPFVILLLAERLLRPNGGQRKQTLAAALVWGFSLSVSAAPFAAELARHPNALWHYDEVSRKQAVALEQIGLSRDRARIEGLRQALTVLQNKDATHSRHAVRPGRPVLDFMLSALATVGFIWCLLHLRSSRSARIAALGFLVFLVPAVTSYPGDGIASVSRRMQGCVFFIAWMAAEGSAVLARGIFTPRYRFPFMVALALSSMLLNAHAIRATYGRHMYLWYDELGGNKALLLPTLREAAAAGPVFFRPTYFTEGILAAVADLPNVAAVRSSAELREKLAPLAGQRCTIVLAWDTATDRNDSPAWIDDLRDLVPPHAWQWGPPDPLGHPVYRIARVRLPDGP